MSDKEYDEVIQKLNEDLEVIRRCGKTLLKINKVMDALSEEE